MTALTLLVLGCRPPQGEAPPTLRLDRHPERLTTLTLPQTSRAEPAPEVIPLPRPFSSPLSLPGMGNDAETTTWQTELPVRHVWHGHSRQKAPPGMVLTGPDGEVPFKLSGEGWSIQKGALMLRLPPDHTPPEHTDYHLTHPASTQQENARNLAWSESTGADFALRDARILSGSRHGVLLPAPATATWEVALFDGAVLDLEVALLRPLVSTEAKSDGAALRVTLTHGETSEEIGRASLLPGNQRTMRIKLPRGLSGTGHLTLESLPAGESELDYLFVTAPTLHRPTDSPRRVVMIFVDTLRPDHLSLYGYERQTSPRLDRWAADGVTFTEARSVAPWTLPSARAALSGVQPERWNETVSLAQRLSQAGFTTAGFVSNAFLSEALGMNRGFDHYADSHFASAEDQVADARALLERYRDRDVAVMIHLMDTHLPYKEPESHRHLWAGDSLLPSRFGRTRLVNQADDDTEVHQYVIDRYDQNIRYVDDSLDDLLSGLSPDDVVVFFSDHGEEFWEHGEVEHGHSLYDEVIRVPLILSGPGLSAATLDAPVSLLDITPTLLDLLGLPHDGLQGTSLLPVIRGEDGAEAVLRARPQAFGRTLYGRTLWATLADGTKRIRQRSELVAYDIASDPGEQDGQPATTAAIQDGLSQALEREVSAVWRLEKLGTGKGSGISGELIVTHPAGFIAAWKAYDPHGWYADPVLEDGVVRVVSTPDRKMPAEVFLLPAAPDPTGLLLTHVSGEVRTESVPGEGEVFQRVGTSSGTVRILVDIAPLPVAGDAEAFFPAEMEDKLRELGYLE
ncbi:MAG: arylsulfatase A-like enzyme [Myxococcota bacterium]|jgi:arylsulfatase A-like enzyme